MNVLEIEPRLLEAPPRPGPALSGEGVVIAD